MIVTENHDEFFYAPMNLSLTRLLPSLIFGLFLFLPEPSWSQESAKSLYDIPPDLVVPPVVNGRPEPGKRVRRTTPGWEKTSVYHALYLPADWKPNTVLPIVVELPGNGNFRRGNDVSHGTVEGCALGYGLTAGTGAVWISLPFVDEPQGYAQNSTTWWGDVEKTKRYCVDTVEDVCRRFGGDSKRVVLAGFSRGAIGCFYIGLHDDEIAGLWAGFFCHSHLDGVRTNWPYPGADRASASERLKRLGSRPVWVSQEGGVQEIRNYLATTELADRFTVELLPYPNHTVHWILRDIPLRKKARIWWHDTVY